MADIDKGGRPDFPPYLSVQAVDFKLTDPTATDPTAPLLMLRTNQRFKMYFTIQVTGSLAFLLTGAGNSWTTTFYADSLGVDVRGELNWSSSGPLQSTGSPDTYEISFDVTSGIRDQGIYDFGTITRLPATGVHAFIKVETIEVVAI